jgi:hypothetical protein
MQKEWDDQLKDLDDVFFEAQTRRETGRSRRNDRKTTKAVLLG